MPLQYKPECIDSLSCHITVRIFFTSLLEPGCYCATYSLGLCKLVKKKSKIFSSPENQINITFVMVVNTNQALQLLRFLR